MALLSSGIRANGQGRQMSVYERLNILNIPLLHIAAPIATFVPFVQSGKLLFLSGHIARRDGEPWIGQLGLNMATEQGKAAARSVAIDMLGTMNGAVGDLNKVKRIVKLTVMVNCTPTFTEQHLVANGASELFQEVFGDNGVHSRCSFGASQIAFGSCVEVELIAEIV